MVVDSGNQTLTLFENGQHYDQMKVVAGKAEYPTPLMASIMYYIVYNPYWNAPDHLARKIARKLSLDGRVLPQQPRLSGDVATGRSTRPSCPTREVDWKAIAKGTVKARIRQKPSGDNSMGDLKFPFPNSQDIFLHDTPQRGIFRAVDANAVERLRPA